MMWKQWRRCRCSGFAATMSLTALGLLGVMSPYVIRGRLSVYILDTTQRSTPATTWWTAAGPINRRSTPCWTAPSKKSPTMVQLNISDVAVLLGRVESAAAGNSEALRPDEVAVRRVSRKLNNALQTFQQDRCRTPGVDFTDTGAWCQSTVDQCHITDRSLADTLGHFLAGSTVLSLGDGTGVYRELILNVSKVCPRQDHTSTFQST